MSFELWVAFVVASSALLAVPGPTVLLALGFALGHGRGSARATVPGTMLGDLTAMTISLLGAGAILATSATLFTMLKLAGAAYLIWLGIQMWRAQPAGLSPTHLQSEANHASMFWKAYVVTALNPKSIVFFIAFVPQFLNPATPLLPQSTILVASFVTLAGLNIALWAMLAGELRQRFRQPRTLRLVNRIGGSFLIGSGALVAVSRRSL